MIALHGGWGTGKTSVKNMVLEKLRGSTAKCPEVVEFSPWQVSGTGNLVGTFFHELGVALGVGQKQKAGLGEKLASYAKHFGFVGHVVKPVGALVSMVEPGTGALIAASAAGLEQSAQTIQAGFEATKAGQEARAKSLADLKRDLGGSLASLPRPVLVVIDDIDRLTTDEILQVFQLVKVNADFPNLVYLLLFERSIVERALDGISGDRGYEFLQKIVQVDFHVPHAHRKAVEKVFFTGLEKCVAPKAINTLFDKERWRNLYVDGVAHYIRNLRHVYRFLGSFGFHVSQFKNGRSFEVNPVDLIGLEVLRVFEPALYEQLPAAKQILTRHREGDLLGGIEQENVNAGVEQLLAHVPADRHKQAKFILEELFPPINSVFGGHADVSSFQEQWLRQHRVCHADLFDKLFALVVGEGDLSQAQLNRMIQISGDKDQFVEECRALLGRRLLSIAFERLHAFVEKIPPDNFRAFLCALCNIGEELPKPDFGQLDPGIGWHAWKLIHSCLSREGNPEARSRLFAEVANESYGLDLTIDVLTQDLRSAEERTGLRPLFCEPYIAELKAICVSRIREKARLETFVNEVNFMTYLIKWYLWGDKEEVRFWVSNHTTTDADFVGLIRRLLNKHSSSGHRGTRLHYSVHLAFMEQFLELDRLKALATRVRPEEFSGLDRTAVFELRKALDRRAKGRGDDVWNESMEEQNEE